MSTQEYAPGRRVIVRGPSDGPVVLLWHGRGVDGASWMLPLAERIAASGGAMALAVDWNSEAADGGRSDLLGSLRHARDLAELQGHDPDSLVVAGWSLGGTAAVSLAVHAKRLGIGLGGAVAIAPGDGPRVTDPISGQRLPERFTGGSGRCRIDLAYGTSDPLSTPDLVAGLDLRLRSGEWRTSLHEVDTDHAGIVGTRFDARTETYTPSSAEHATKALHQIAAIVVAATGS